ncbi:MAG: amylo-alpha-1,6-glucosidase, partial [Limisphaerales bacterium]
MTKVFKSILAGCLLQLGAFGVFAKDVNAVFRVETDSAHARISTLSWDTEGGDRAKLNLLRPGTGVALAIKIGGQWRDADAFKTKVEKTGASETRYRLLLATNSELEWTIHSSAEKLRMTFRSIGSGLTNLEEVELRFPFAPLATSTTLLPSAWDKNGKLHLPAIISAPDLGQILLASKPEKNLKGKLIGNRAIHTVDFILELPRLRSGKTISLSFSPVRLPTPSGLQNKSMWRGARRGWFNEFQSSSQWGDQNGQVSAPPGLLANNVVSDPVSCLLHQWADQMLLTPNFSKDICLSDAVRHTIDWWLDSRTKTNGEVFAYWGHADMLDANASPLIAAWDYVEASGDRKWLARRIERLEFIADYLLKRDIDADGLIESNHSGNAGTLIEPMRAGSAYDTINAGYKDAYCNALIYRAFRCLADLEKQLKRVEQQKKYSERAELLKTNYVKTFFNPKSGWLAWWKSQDGEVHDLSSPMISSVAICYGLIDPEQGREIMGRLWKKINAVGFKRFDLGVPITLTPVPRGDYLLHPTATGDFGIPRTEDGSDTFGTYLNGGCMVNDAVYFITAN